MKSGIPAGSAASRNRRRHTRARFYPMLYGTVVNRSSVIGVTQGASEPIEEQRDQPARAVNPRPTPEPHMRTRPLQSRESSEQTRCAAVSVKKPRSGCSRRVTAVMLLCVPAVTALGPASGCAVPQPRGRGLYERMKEPKTGAVYHLYLPVDYVQRNGRHPEYPKVKRWPLVMTFHGMKPYDNAIPQEREWEQEADTYGYIVCSPELHTSDSFMEYPLTREHSYVLRDRKNVMAIMDDVFSKTLADRKRVLATSWSCGGYLAHYFVNRYPEKFSCLATRLSNFSAKLLDDHMVPRYRKKIPVAIFIGDGDFPKCKSESEEAVAWYRARGFSVVGKMIDHMGHRRIPQTAAAFFAKQLGIKPLHPIAAAQTVAQVQMTEYVPPQELLARLSPKLVPREAALASAKRSASPRIRRPRSFNNPSFTYASAGAGREYPFSQVPPYDAQPRGGAARSRSGAGSTTPPTGAGATRIASARRPNAGWMAPTKEPARSSIARPAQATSPSRSSSARGTDRTPPKKAGRTGGASSTRLPAPEVTATPTYTRRQFTPKTAGPVDYDTWKAYSNQLASAKNTRRKPAEPPRAAAPKPKVASKPPAARPTRRGTAAPRQPERQTGPKTKVVSARARRTRPRQPPKKVTVLIKGPAVANAPFFLDYGVDLSPEVTRGADFRWYDNGVLLGDEPNGTAILESPGPHEIAVLLITRDNIEYRGASSVQVLADDPSRTASTALRTRRNRSG